MDIRQITPSYFVAPQLDPADMPEIAAAGIKTVICNRPDAEVPPAFQADALEAAVRRDGCVFHASIVNETGRRRYRVGP